MLMISQILVNIMQGGWVEPLRTSFGLKKCNLINVAHMEVLLVVGHFSSRSKLFPRKFHESSEIQV